MATEEGRYYLEILLREPFRAFLKAVIEISQNPILILMFLQMGFFAFILGFVTDFVLTRLIDIAEGKQERTGRLEMTS